MPHNQHDSGIRPTPPRSLRRGVVPLLLLFISIAATCWFFDRWTWRDFCVPVGYAVDSVAHLANGKAFAEGTMPWNTEVKRLNAPFTAIWDDAPLVEKIMLIFYGFQQRYLPPGAAMNSMNWLALLTSVLGCYAAARWIGAFQLPAATVALLFGFSHYMTFRSSGHIHLALAWHVPFMFALIHRLFTQSQLSRPDWYIGIGLSFAAAILNPYYGFFHAYLMSLSLLIFLIRRNWKKSMFTLALVVMWLATFVINLSGYFITSAKLGPNPGAVVRGLADLNRWGLRLPDLFWPIDHPLECWNRIAASWYFGAGNPIDEHASSFLGLAGLFALAILLIHTFSSVAKGRHREITTEAWCVLFAVIYALQGGINLILGSFGFVMLRATNRYSILILCASLLFMARWWLPKFRTVHMALICLSLLLIQFWELSTSPRRRIGTVMENNRAVVSSDKDFGTRLEAALPPHAMVFQLPVWDYPESHPRHLMTDYAHFRPYIWTKHLRFSYGSCKGRVREAWQRNVENLPAPEMIKTLESMGFSAIFINRQAYTDDAAALEASIVAAGRRPLVESKNRHFITYRLEPAETIVVPLADPVLNYGRGFYIPGDGPGTLLKRVTSGNAQLMLQRGDVTQSAIVVSANIHCDHPQKITISAGGDLLWEETFDAGQSSMARWMMEPAKPVAIIDVKTDAPAARLPNTGGYLSGFSVELGACYPLTTNVIIGTGFFDWEHLPDGRRLAWAGQSTGAEIIILPGTNDTPRKLSITVVSPSTMHQTLRLEDRVLWQGIVPAGEPTPIAVEIPPGNNEARIVIDTNLAPRRLSENDSRVMTFALMELELQ